MQLSFILILMIMCLGVLIWIWQTDRTMSGLILATSFICLYGLAIIFIGLPSELSLKSQAAATTPALGR